MRSGVAIREVEGSRAGPMRRLRGRIGQTGWVGISVFAVTAVLSVVAILINSNSSASNIIWSLLTLSVVTAIAAYGQTVVVLTGGLDLSIPWTMTMAGVFLSAWSGTSASKGVFAFATVLVLGAVVGLVNGLGIVVLKVPAVVMTLAVNAVLQGIVLIYTNGAPSGGAPHFLTGLMNERGPGGVPHSVWVLLAAAVVGVFVLRGTTFGRRIYAVGASRRAAVLSGLRVNATIVTVYLISGVASALAGALLTGFSQHSFLGMGDQYLLPSIAAVVIGGASVMGGRGSYLGTVAGVLLLTSIGIVLSGRSSDATKTVIFGASVLVTALLFNRSRRNQ